MPTTAKQRTYPYGNANRWLVLFIATIGIYGCSNDSKCEDLMAKLFSSHSSEFISGGCIDSKQAYLYPFNNINVLMFASVSKDTFVIDSIIDFNHSFIKYANMEKMDKAISEKYYSINRTYSISKEPLPAIHRKKDNYILIDEHTMYEISFQNKKIKPILRFRNTNFMNYFKRSERKAYFFPEYTKIIFYPKFEDEVHSKEISHFVLHRNGEITANVDVDHCLIVRKLATKEEEIQIFGDNCPEYEFEIFDRRLNQKFEKTLSAYCLYCYLKRLNPKLEQTYPGISRLNCIECFLEEDT